MDVIVIYQLSAVSCRIVCSYVTADCAQSCQTLTLYAVVPHCSTADDSCKQFRRAKAAHDVLRVKNTANKIVNNCAKPPIKKAAAAAFLSVNIYKINGFTKNLYPAKQYQPR
jgi:hypothetical protein